MDLKSNKILPFSLATIGIVYGDIGTSPLYALRVALAGLPITADNVYGILSLIFWSLILVISIKYLIYILRFDNKGEGGILALLALIKKEKANTYKMLFIISIIGAALLLSDGMLTPAISVMSAVEGLNVISPVFSHLTLPLTFTILLCLYLVQHHGTAKIGSSFGPILLIWFITIAILGVVHISDHPNIIQALNPHYAWHFFIENGWRGYLVLGSIFLVITGGEALYTDLGHFGKSNIRWGWFSVVLPSLLLNYFGQGANLLSNPQNIDNPFYALAPDWFAYPLLLIATLASIIASQAIISATFSLTKQAVLLDLFPKIRIIQTSKEKMGQIYVPVMNVILAIGTLSLVIIFKNSHALAHAYGIAVNMEMVCVTFLIIFFAYKSLKWPVAKVVAFSALFLTIDLAFLGSNLIKIESGGWVPILIAFVFSTIMITWYQGIQYLRRHHYKDKKDLKGILNEIMTTELKYLPLPDTLVVFIANPYDKSGGNLLNFLKLHKIMPEHTLIISTSTENSPYVHSDKYFECSTLGNNIHRLILHNGFMQLINIPDALAKAAQKNIFSFDLDIANAVYIIEIPNASPTTRHQTLKFHWQERLFSILLKNSSLDIQFYHLPYKRTIAMGSYFEI